MSTGYRVAIGAALTIPLAAVFGWQAVSGKLNQSTAVHAASVSKQIDAASVMTTKVAPVAPVAAATQPAAATMVATSITLPKPTDMHPGELAADALFAQSSPAVVRVICQNGDLTGMQGSGFFISPDGVLVTNYHVIRGAEFASIIRGDDTTVFVEGVVAQDPKADLAILKLNVKDVPFLTLNGQTVPRVGTKVFAIGNPDGLTNTLSEGLISGIRDKSTGLPSIQTTAAISHGSSGGPLLSTDGQVVGVTTAMLAAGQNLNFAVPASQINDLLSSNQAFQKLSSAGLAPLVADDTHAFAKVYGFLAARDFSAAARQIELVRPTQQNNPLFWLTRGMLYTELKNETVAIDSFTQAERINPSSEAAWYYKGLSYLRFSRYPEAQEALFAAIKVKPKDARAYMTLGWMYEKMHRIDRAEKSFTRVTEITPNDPEAYNGLSLVYFDEQRYPTALSMAQKATALNPNYGPAYIAMGMSHIALRQYSEAQMDLQNAIRVDPTGGSGLTARKMLRQMQAKLAGDSR